MQSIETLILAETSDAVIALDPEYRVTYWNPAAERLYGITAQEALGRPLQHLYRPEWPSPLAEQQAMAQLQRSGTWRGEITHVRRDGTRRYVDSTVNALPPDSGGGLLAIIRDITARRQAQMQSEERQFLEAITGVAPVLLYVYDLTETRTVWINEGLSSVLGYDATEIDAMGREVLPLLLHPQDIARYPEHFERLRQLGPLETAIFEYRMRHKNGDWVWLQSYERPFRRDSQGLVDQIVGAGLDISEQKRAQAKLAENETRQRFLLQLSDTLRPLTDPVAIQNEASRLLGQQLRAHRVAYADIQGDRATVWRDYCDGVPSVAGEFHVWDFGESVIRAYQRGELVNQPDVQRDYSLSDAAREAFARLQVASNLSRGLIKDGKWVAALTVHHATPRIWTDIDIALLDETAQRTWDAVERARAERLSLDSQRTLQSFYDSAPFLMGLAELDGDRTLAISGNRAMGEFLGKHPDELPGRYGSELGAPPDLDQKFVECYRRSQSEGTPVHFDYALATEAGTTHLSTTVAFLGIGASGRPRFSFVSEDVTDRKRAAEDVARAAERAEVAQRAASAMIFEVNVKTGEIFRSPLAADLLGYDQHEITPDVHGWYAIIHPDDLPAVTRAFEDSVQQGVDLHIEYRVRHKHGHWLWVSDHARIMRDEQGHIERMVGFVSDITKRRRIQAALEESEARFRMMADGIPNILWVTGSDAGLQFVNRAYREFVGLTEADLGDHRWRSLIHPDDQESYLSEFLRCVRDQVPFHARCRLRRPDGSWSWIASYANPRFAPDGTFLGHAGSSADIDDLIRTQHELRESEQRFRELAENMSQFAWMARPDGYIFWYNRRWFEYTGTNLEQMRGWGWRSVHHPDHVDRVSTGFAQAINNGEPWEDTFPLRAADGSFRWFLSRAVPIRDDQQRIIRWFGTNTDITHQLEIERELRRANHDLEQFAYSASHDLQAPLRNIAIYSQLLERDYAPHLDTRGVSILQNIVGGAVKMSSLIADLLAYSRAGARDQGPLELIRPSEVLDSVLTDLEQMIRETGASITFDPIPDLYIRPAHLHSLFQNLIGNALKYRKPDLAPHVHITGRSHANSCQISITDNGIGIDPAYQNTVFGIFKRLHSDSHGYPGTGIGLAICQRIVDSYGGRIWFLSEPGAGSTFHFTLPLPGAPRGRER